MIKYVFWIFKILWTCLSFFIANYVRIRYDIGLAMFLVIVVPLLLIGDFLADRYIKAKE